MADADPRIRISSVPEGEAPLWVREQWVGLTLPVWSGSRGPGPFTMIGFGVLTGPTAGTIAQLWAGIRGKHKVISGFVVETDHAIEALGPVAPEAATWWRDYLAASPKSRRYLLFDKRCCAIVT